MIPAFLVAKLGEKGARACVCLAWLLLVAAVLLLAYCSGRYDGKHGAAVAELKRENAVKTQVSMADAGAAATRVQDAVRTQQQTEELHDALAATNDPDRQRLVRGCAILRQQGRDTSRIPACGGPASRP